MRKLSELSDVDAYWQHLSNITTLLRGSDVYVARARVQCYCDLAGIEYWSTPEDPKPDGPETAPPSPQTLASTPRYKHLCSMCLFLGAYGVRVQDGDLKVVDLYFCAGSGHVGYRSEDARGGKIGSCGDEHFSTIPAYVEPLDSYERPGLKTRAIGEAYERACARGLMGPGGAPLVLRAEAVAVNEAYLTCHRQP